MLPDLRFLAVPFLVLSLWAPSVHAQAFAPTPTLDSEGQPSTVDLETRRRAYEGALFTKAGGGHCVGFPAPSRGCWQCSEPSGPAVCGGPLNPAGSTPLTRHGRPAHCPGGGPSYPLGPCCERRWQTAEALALAWCAAWSTSGADNRAGLVGWQSCSGEPGLLEVLDAEGTFAESHPVYALARGLSVVPTVEGFRVRLAITRPLYSAAGAVVAWGDGASSIGVTGTAEHTYTALGRYRVRVDAPDACGVTREVSAVLELAGPSIDPPPPGGEDPLCPSEAETVAWLESLCARDDVPGALSAGCLLLAAERARALVCSSVHLSNPLAAACGLPGLPPEEQHRLVCEWRRWVHETGHGGTP